MQPATQQTKPTRSPASRLAALAAAAPWRRSACLASLAIGLGGIVSTAQATLLVYEGFDYPSTQWTTLNAQNGGTGFASAWSAASMAGSTYPAASPAGFAICDSTMNTLWNGTVTSVPQTGKFVGSPAPAWTQAGGLTGNNPDHLWAWRTLDPTVTAMFVPGSTTWMSYVEASDFKNNANSTGGMLAIGSGYFGVDTRGDSVINGTAIGIGINYGSKRFTAAVWTASTHADNGTGLQIGPTGTGTPFTNGSDRKAQIGLAKIVWGDASNPTTIQVCAFTDGAILTEAAFNSSTTLVTNTVTIDPATVTKLSLGGARYNVDELRIGTTFNDAIGVVAVSYGNYWAPGASGGGSGNWDSATLDWAGAPNTQGALGQSPTANLVFAGTAGTTTINGTAAAAAGIQFSVDGYTLAPGTSTPNLSLTGATPAANTIAVNSGTATISVQITGSNGMTKDGAGSLVLSNIGNTYSGGTVLSAGTLQIAALASLGSGIVTFGGGTLQYPAGSGTSSIDISGKINPVASGQMAKIDTNGYDVTFGTAISGDGGLTKLGSGSLTLAADVTSLAGGVTASGGTLNVSSASGTITTLNVPSGGTVNLGTGTTITTLNITGGTVHITGTGVSVGTLVAKAGMLEAATNSLAVTTQATVAGMLFSGTAITLSGANVIAPDSGNHCAVATNSGTLAFAATGLDAAIGISQPGSPAVPTTATFSGGGVWDLHGGAAADIANFYGVDNHAFHYIQVPSGDFDIIVHVTATTNAQVGLMARDNLAAHTGDSAGIWTGMSATTINGAISAPGISTPGNPWLRVTKVGNIVTTSYSSNGSTYTQAKYQDYSAHPWGATTYLGLDLTNTTGAVGSAHGSYSNVNFMGTASMAELRTTDLVLSGGAQCDLNYAGTMRIGALSINGVTQGNGTYGSSAASPPPDFVSDVNFVSTSSGTLTLGKVTPVITWSNPAAIDEGTALSGTQLNAGCSAYGTLTYTPPAGTVLPAGSNNLHVDFAPTDTDSYNTASADVSIVINAIATPYSTWATTTNGLSGADADFGADPDHDGLSNGIEFVVGGQPNPANAGANSCALLPTLAVSGTNLVFTYRRTALAATQPGMVINAEYGTALTAWTTAQDGVNGVSIVTTTDGFEPGVDKVEVTLPASLTGTGRLFARLNVSTP